MDVRRISEQHGAEVNTKIRTTPFEPEQLRPGRMKRRLKTRHGLTIEKEGLQPFLVTEPTHITLDGNPCLLEPGDQIVVEQDGLEYEDEFGSPLEKIEKELGILEAIPSDISYSDMGKTLLAVAEHYFGQAIYVYPIAVNAETVSIDPKMANWIIIGRKELQPEQLARWYVAYREEYDE